MLFDKYAFNMLSMSYSINEISFETILPIWRNELWPGRPSIESRSAMMITPGKYDIENLHLPLWCYGCYVNNNLIGVNSGHLCTDGSLRIRGFWVNKDFRRKGIGRLLLEKTISDAWNRNIGIVWAFPRKTSWRIFESLGFKLLSDWEISETSNANAYCYIKT